MICSLDYATPYLHSNVKAVYLTWLDKTDMPEVKTFFDTILKLSTKFADQMTITAIFEPRDHAMGRLIMSWVKSNKVFCLTSVEEIGQRFQYRGEENRIQYQRSLDFSIAPGIPLAPKPQF